MPKRGKTFEVQAFWDEQTAWTRSVQENSRVDRLSLSLNFIFPAKCFFYFSFFPENSNSLCWRSFKPLKQQCQMKINFWEDSQWNLNLAWLLEGKQQVNEVVVDRNCKWIFCFCCSSETAQKLHDIAQLQSLRFCLSSVKRSCGMLAYESFRQWFLHPSAST